MAISRDEVLHVARLARLELGEDEIEEYTRQLSRILEHIQKLQRLDTKDVPPTSHVLDLKNVLRADETRPGLSREEALSNAPDAVSGFFRVPKIRES
ncbi:MAG: Asp-tRNA(Asn)/Glu-tRNA(Gln) amidotransferase subunit GatC [Firmicutes bacterium]|jgi:aspartyl-tRNA(Asn)/glutamyl-tRNA(Gln) amidotransferase subunit C|nr:Asp-tRNA(Asn)/Glu-tRNA(Gln) amidotransferase subunit GatC [Bacillota bacterium]